MLIKTCFKKKSIAEENWVLRQALACWGKHGGMLRPSQGCFGCSLPAPSWWRQLCCQCPTTLRDIGGLSPCGDSRFCYPGFGRPCIPWSCRPREEAVGCPNGSGSNWDQWVGGEKHERPGVCILRQAVTRVGPRGSRPFLRSGMGPGAYDPASLMDASS